MQKSQSGKDLSASDQLLTWPCAWVAVTTVVSGGKGKVGEVGRAQSCRISPLTMKRGLVVCLFFSKVHLDASEGFLSREMTWLDLYFSSIIMATINMVRE